MSDDTSPRTTPSTNVARDVTLNQPGHASLIDGTPTPRATAVSYEGSTDLGDQFLRRFVVITATIVASTIAIGIIFITALIPFYSDQNAPDQLVNWGGIIIGFYFGTFASLLKDWLSGGRSTGDDK